MENACVPSADIVVFFHHGCIDAAYGNLAVHTYHQNSTIIYYSKASNLEVRVFPLGRLYYFIEIADENLLRTACEHAEKVVVIDHHHSNLLILDELQV